jgi:hypothetical protein
MKIPDADEALATHGVNSIRLGRLLAKKMPRQREASRLGPEGL